MWEHWFRNTWHLRDTELQPGGVSGGAVAEGDSATKKAIAHMRKCDRRSIRSCLWGVQVDQSGHEENPVHELPRI